MFERAAILGIGLIGGSFGLALKERQLAREVVGVARRPSTLESAVKVGACDFATSDTVEAVRGADLVFLAAPVGQMAALCQSIAPHLSRETIVTDGGSTKAQLVRDCEAILKSHAQFIGGHPMAGSEKTGVEAARSDLFERAKWLLTPTPSTSPEALTRLQNLVTALGSHVITLSPEAHDQLLAVTSHLPHLTAAALVHSFIGAQGNYPEADKLVAGGWRDSTRIAAGSPEMWRDICLANAEAIGNEISGLITQLQQLQNALQAQDGPFLEQWLETAAQVRRSPCFEKAKTGE